MKRSALGTVSRVADDRSRMRRFGRRIALGLIAANLVALLVYWLSFDFGFARIVRLEAPLAVSFLDDDGQRVRQTVTEAGFRIRTRTVIESDDPGRIHLEIRGRGLLVVDGPVRMTIRPEHEEFAALRMGTLYYLADRDDRKIRPEEPVAPSLFLDLAANASSVDQGQTAVFQVDADQPLVRISGKLGYRELFFVAADTNGRAFHALQGIEVRDEAVTNLLLVRGESADGDWVKTVQPFPVRVRSYRPGATPERFFKAQAKSKGFSQAEVARLAREWREKRERVRNPLAGLHESRVLQPVFTGISPRWLPKGPFRVPGTAMTGISSIFGVIRYLSSPEGLPHRGIDYTADTGAPVLAAAAGNVVLTDEFDISGRIVVIDHGLGVFSTYLHLDRILTRPGTAVRAGDLIGQVGSTGYSTGPHLHFGVKVGNIYVDPNPWLAGSVWPPRRMVPLARVPRDSTDSPGKD